MNSNNFFNQNIFKPEEKKEQSPFQQNIFGQPQQNQFVPQQNQFGQTSPFQQPSAFQPQTSLQSHLPLQQNTLQQPGTFQQPNSMQPQSSFQPQNQFGTFQPFIQNKPMFSSTQPTFGSINKPSLFGQSTFNQPTQSSPYNFQFNQSSDLEVKKGTSNPKYSPTRQKEIGSYEYQTFLDITLMNEYKDKNTTELRIEDYLMGRKPAQSAVNTFSALAKDTKPPSFSSTWGSTPLGNASSPLGSSSLAMNQAPTTSSFLNPTPSVLPNTSSILGNRPPVSTGLGLSNMGQSSVFGSNTSTTGGNTFTPSSFSTTTPSSFGSNTQSSLFKPQQPSSFGTTPSIFGGSTSTGLSQPPASPLPQTTTPSFISQPAAPTTFASGPQSPFTQNTAPSQSLFTPPATQSSIFSPQQPSLFSTNTTQSVFPPQPMQYTQQSTFAPQSTSVQPESKPIDQIALYIEEKIKRDPYSIEELKLEDLKEEEILPTRKFQRPKFRCKDEYFQLELRDKITRPLEIDTIPSQESLSKLSSVNLVIIFKEGRIEYLESIKASDCYIENIKDKIFFSKESVKCLDPIGVGLNKKCRISVNKVISDCGLERFVWRLKQIKDRKFVSYDESEMIYVYEVEHL